MYIKVQQNDDIYLLDKSMIAILAPWCGYCKELKESHVLDDLSKKIDIIEISDTHKDADRIMEKSKHATYPCLVLYKNGRLIAFKDERNLRNLNTFLKKLF
jgi:thiol-disulfide isomerase/thioredoxin